MKEEMVTEKRRGDEGSFMRQKKVNTENDKKAGEVGRMGGRERSEV